MEDLPVKIDKYGWEYLDHVPEGYRVGNLDDFHVKGNKRIGMHFLIRWSDREYYEIKSLKEEMTASWLKEFMDWDRVFVRI